MSKDQLKAELDKLKSSQKTLVIDLCKKIINEINHSQLTSVEEKLVARIITKTMNITGGSKLITELNDMKILVNRAKECKL